MFASIQVAAEVFAPNSKKPIVKVDGEWNGKMIAKWASGKNEVFIDVEKLPLHPKICKSVAQQSRFESRRLWKNITYNLKVLLIIHLELHTRGLGFKGSLSS